MGASFEDYDSFRFGQVRQCPNDVDLLIVCRTAVGHDVDGPTIAPASFVQRSPMEFPRWNVVVNDDQQVMVAVFARGTARARSEEDYLARIEILDDRLQQVIRNCARSHPGTIVSRAYARDCHANAAAPIRLR